uniref:ORF30 n=1 Tax=Malaco herpesvirus 1 TaxID=3031797 RepID=A0AA48P937_9VIRU|nr:TPA_asm: ORF30 [Malaco herpesvirus 1]
MLCNSSRSPAVCVASRRRGTIMRTSLNTPLLHIFSITDFKPVPLPDPITPLTIIPLFGIDCCPLSVSRYLLSLPSSPLSTLLARRTSYDISLVMYCSMSSALTNFQPSSTVGTITSVFSIFLTLCKGRLLIIFTLGSQTIRRHFMAISPAIHRSSALFLTSLILSMFLAILSLSSFGVSIHSKSSSSVVTGAMEVRKGNNNLP